MSIYTGDHAGALADVRAAGADVVFTHTVPGSYDPATDTSGDPVITTLTGAAIRTKGDPVRYERLGLTQSEAPTLFFVPNTQGDLPEPGSLVTWATVGYAVRDVQPLAPDGIAIAANVVLVR
jgi:hypothetical protein